MPVQASEIERLIKDAFPDAQVTITDLAGDGNLCGRGDRRELCGQNRVQQQRAVYAARQETGPLSCTRWR
jgi:stress-induced morphogen